MFRSRLVREGSVGLFFLFGVIVFGSVVFYLKGRNPQNPEYQVKLLFENAGGLKEGARVYYRGVAVGTVIGIQPSSNGVEILTEIDGSLRIPKNVSVSTLRSGLLGEVSINVVPQSEIPDTAVTINPLDKKKCPQQQFILCDGQKINGITYPDVVESLSLLADRINNDQLFELLTQTLINVNETTEKMTTLTDEATTVAGQLNQSLKTFSTTSSKIGNTADSLTLTADALTTTANVASDQIDHLGNSYSNVGLELNLLANKINLLIDDNRTNFSNAVASFSTTTAEVSRLINNTDKLLSNVNPDDVVAMSKNLNQTSENLANISRDLKQISEELNDPTNLVTLQETLDSARVTFANTAKITADIDEFTGDPEFRNNLRKLVDGLGNLVSYTEMLEKQVELAKMLEEFENIQVKENNSIAIDKNKPTSIDSQPFPTAFSSSHKIKLKNKNEL
jgi:phospholipid/cholesterol/gamma-HCH transport system substrate-binding protein